MMSDGEKIAERLEAMGVVFPNGRPDRAHCRVQGELRDTFLVYGLHKMSNMVDWQYQGRKGICVMLTEPARHLAKVSVALELEQSGWGPYGSALFVHDALTAEAQRELDWQNMLKNLDPEERAEMEAQGRPWKKERK